MTEKIYRPSYFKEYLEETHKETRESEQSGKVPEIVREIEIFISANEEEERKMAHPDHQLSEEFELETLDKVPMEDKLLLSREEESLTPGELADIINEQMQDLPDVLIEDSGPEIFEVCFLVAEEVAHRLRGF